MAIDINTKFITLIGTPLSQSFAARMQNRAYDEAGLNMRYFYTETDSEHLEEIIAGIRYMPSFKGAAVTKPNKVNVLPYLDELDPICRKFGACNTVVKTEDGKLIGYNTDGLGFHRSITQEAGFTVEDSTVFCFGAGGAGRAICSILAYYGAKKIYITDYFEASSASLVEDINTMIAEGPEPVAVQVPYGAYDGMDQASLVINASGIGMGKTMGQSPMPAERINPQQLYFDACYNPDKTQFLLNAEAAGARILNGLGMSLYQGVAQIELWAPGVEAPVDAMRDELMKILNEQTH